MQLTNGSSRISSLLAFLVVLIALPAIAVQATYIGTLEGSQEVPPVATDAAGEACTEATFAGMLSLSRLKSITR